MGESNGEQAEYRATFDAIVDGCASDLLAREGIDVAPGASDSALEYVAVIGFAGDHVRGAMGVGVSSSVISATRSSQAEQEDWLGELANQLLGRVKNRLIGYGVVVSMSTPMVLRGLRVELGGSHEAWSWRYSGASGQVCIWLDARFGEGFALVPSEDPDAQSAPEGELMLF